MPQFVCSEPVSYKATQCLLVSVTEETVNNHSPFTYYMKHDVIRLL